MHARRWSGGIPWGMLWRQRLGDAARGELRCRQAVVLTVMVGCALASGCRKTSKRLSPEEQVQISLDRFYDKEPDCLWQRPIALRPATAPSEGILPNEMRALLGAGLIDASHGGVVLTEAGRKAWLKDPYEPERGNLCFGKWRVSRVESMTARHDDVFGDVMETEFDVTMPTAAAWARLPGMQQAFPRMAITVSRTLPHVATMKLTDTGWQVAAAIVPSSL